MKAFILFLGIVALTPVASFAAKDIECTIQISNEAQSDIQTKQLVIPVGKETKGEFLTYRYTIEISAPALMYSVTNPNGFRISGGGHVPNEESALTAVGIDKVGMKLVGLNCLLHW